MGKGAKMGSPWAQSASFLQEKIWNELITDMEEIFLMKLDNFMFLLQYLLILSSVYLFSLVTEPV